MNDDFDFEPEDLELKPMNLEELAKAFGEVTEPAPIKKTCRLNGGHYNGKLLYFTKELLPQRIQIPFHDRDTFMDEGTHVWRVEVYACQLDLDAYHNSTVQYLHEATLDQEKESWE